MKKFIAMMIVMGLLLAAGQALAKGKPPRCGDGVCELPETPTSCPNDCNDGGGGGGGSSDAPDPYNLVRASFANFTDLASPGGGMVADGRHTCTIQRNGGNVTYDYWAWQERLLSDANSLLDDGVGTNWDDATDSDCRSTENRSDISGGGRWFLMTTAGEVQPEQVERWLVVDFSVGIDGSECPDLDGIGNADLGIDPIYFPAGTAVEHPHPAPNSAPCVDNLTVRFAADRILKNRAEYQSPAITIRYRPNGSDYWIPWGSITHINPLYLRDPSDDDGDPFKGRDCRVMSTRPAWDLPHDRQEAELSMFLTPSEEVLIGNYNLPLEVCVIRASD